MVIQFFLQLIITTFRMFCADLKFLKDTLGHKGCASLHPCSICRVSKNELNNLGQKRIFEEDSEKQFSCLLPPLLSIKNFTILAPCMHITHGILNKAMLILWKHSGENAAEISCGIIGVKPDAHTHQFIG